MSELNQELDFSQPRGAERNFFGSLAFMGSWLWQTKLSNTIFSKLDSFNWITPHLILGSIAMATAGDEQKIRGACQAQGKELGLVIGAVAHHEMRGHWCVPAVPIQWG